MVFKRKGTILSIYVPDNNVLEKVKKKSAEQDRTISQWTYLVMRNAVMGNDKENGGKSAALPEKHSTTPTEPEPTPTGVDVSNVY
jgi:hypothetical protein